MNKKILLSSTSSDSHTWSLVFLQLLLEENGYDVVNLGSCVPDSIVIDSVRKFEPHAMVITSVNGLGHLDGARLIRALRWDSGGRGLPAVIGGKLGMLGESNEQYVNGLRAAGFDAVFADSSPDALIKYLGSLPSRQGRSAAETLLATAT